MTRPWLVLAALALGACAPGVPEPGVGFNDYAAYQSARAQREQVLAGQQPLLGGPMPIAVTPVGGGPAATAPLGAPLSATQIPPAPGAATPAGISDEQDFDAVSARETIESDAERLARLRDQYQVIDPGALPERVGNTGPNIVEFALATTNAVGQSVYRRSGFNASSRSQRACARFTTPDEAQRAFLSRGGPERDPLGVDPDGDGFACFWDPSPFRAARGG